MTAATTEKLGDRIVNDIKSSRLVKVPHCGHVPMNEAPDAFVNYVLPFLEETSS